MELDSMFLEDLHTVLSEGVTAWLGEDLEVVMLEVAEEFNLASGDNADIDVRTRTQVVVDTSFDGSDTEVDCLFLGKVLSVVSFKNGHSCERT